MSDASQLRACAAIVQCTRHATAARLAEFLWALADRLDQEEGGDK